MSAPLSNIIQLSQICKNLDKSPKPHVMQCTSTVSTVVTLKNRRKLMNSLRVEDTRSRQMVQVSTDLDHGRFVLDALCRVIAFDPVAARFLSEANIWVIDNQTLKIEVDGNAQAAPQDVLAANATVFIGASQPDGEGPQWLASARRLDEFSFELRIAESRPFDARRVADLGQLFGISRSEMLVVRAIIDGGNVDAIAKKMGLSQNTVRTHIKRVHSKLGIHDTAGLVALCLAYSI
jgi:DNA-binding CsgD family transcriptional regulator